MSPFNVLIIEEQYDTNGDDLEPKILFGPELIFAETKRGAIKKAAILSKIPVKEIENVNFYVNKFDYVSDYGENNL